MLSFKIPALAASIYSGAAFLIISGVVFDISERIESIQKINDSGCKKICNVAFDEVEAVIKKTVLEKNEIECIIEPIRFTWGMPIRTAVDEYRLHVKNENVKQAKELLFCHI